MSGAQIYPVTSLLPAERRIDRLFHRYPLLWMLLAAAVGITGDTLLLSLAVRSDPRWLTCYVTTAIILTLLLLVPPGRIGKAASTVLSARPLVSVLLLIPLAAAWHRVGDCRYHRASLAATLHWEAQPVVVTGTVSSPVALRRARASASYRTPWQTVFEVDVDTMRDGLAPRRTNGRLLTVVEGDCESLRPGDRIRLYGSASSFMAPTNPGQRDMRAHYRSLGLHGRLQVDGPNQIHWIQRRGGVRGTLQRVVATMAIFGRRSLLRHTDAKSGPLAIALVLGQREFLDRQTRDLLLVTGTAHLLSVSGMHLAIVVLLAHWIAVLVRLPLGAKTIWILGVCLLYTSVTGGRPPVLRAAILVATFLFAVSLKRTSQPLNTLAFAGLILLAANPNLLFSMGVQLSFLAVATLLQCGATPQGLSEAARLDRKQHEQLAELLEDARPLWLKWSRRIAAAFLRMAWFSLCVTLICSPLIWFHFHVVSLVSVVVNVILAPLMFLSLASGLATIFASAIDTTTASLSIAWMPGMLCNVLLQAMRVVIEEAALVPGGHWWLPSPPWYFVALFYLVIALTRFIVDGGRRRLVTATALLCWWLCAVRVATTPASLPDRMFEATFVDVGHGTSVVLRLSETEIWLYDCGRLGNDDFRSHGIQEVLWSLGVTRLRGVIVSHADADHFNALPGLLRRFSVQQVLTSPGMLEEPEPALVEVRRVIQEEAVPVRELRVGDVLGPGNVATRMNHRTSRSTLHASATGQDQSENKFPMRILHPPAARLPGSDNANSLVLRVDVGKRSLLLPGDVEPPGIAVLLAQPRPAPGGVLMAPHHGSLQADAGAVLHWARPRHVIVSGGRRARRVAVGEMLAATGSSVHVTSVTGAMRVRMDSQGGVEVRGWLRKPW